MPTTRSVELPGREFALIFDRKIAALVAERIPDGATIQAAFIGAIRRPRWLRPARRSTASSASAPPSCSATNFIDLDRSRGVVTDAHCKRTHRNKAITTSAMSAHQPALRVQSPTTRVASSSWPAATRPSDPKLVSSRAPALQRDQRDDRGRFPRPVRLQEMPRLRLLVLETVTPARCWSPAARSCSEGRPGIHRPPLDHRRRLRLTSSSPASTPVACRHHLQDPSSTTCVTELRRRRATAVELDLARRPRHRRSDRRRPPPRFREELSIGSALMWLSTSRTTRSDGLVTVEGRR